MTASRTRPPPLTSRAGPGRRLSEAGIAVLLACAFLPIVDFFIVNVALPTINSTLRGAAPMLELVVAGYGTVYAALLVLGGRLGDTYGRRRVLTIGLAGFTATSLLCGLAPSIDLLVAARLAQGAAAALIVPQVLATFQATLEPQRRTRALGLYGATAGIAGVVGQLAGGLLVSADIAGSTWRPIFLLNVPIGLTLITLLPALVPDTRSDRPAGIDRLGTLLFAATLIAVLVPLAEGRDVHWAVWTWAVLGLAPVLAAATYAVERRAELHGEVPLLPPSLLALQSVRRGLALGLPFFLGFGAFMFVFALTVQDGLHASPLHSGLVITPFALAFLLASLLTPPAIDRFGRGALALGTLLQAIGLGVLIGTVSVGWPHVSLGALAPGLLVAGFGQAFVFGSLLRLVLADVPQHLAGIGGGVLITLQQSGLALGVASLGTLYLGLAGTGVAHIGTAFATVVGIQVALAVVLLAGTRLLPAARPAPPPAH